MPKSNSVKPIAIYLPQFHRIHENDKWWGEGFTEWTNVRKAKPVFDDHYQPHVPLNKDYYDLSDIEVMRNQAALAESYGIHGFCFYHYWFNGKLLLEKPIHNWLNSDIDFPFCLSWANENWTRRWDGNDKKVLMQQDYSDEDDLAHIKYLLEIFKDPRYIKIDGKPVLLMYRTELHPNIKIASEVWRDVAKKAGFPDLYLIRMENFQRYEDPCISGFDAGMEFAPDGTLLGQKIHKKNMVKYLFKKCLHLTGIEKNEVYENGIYDYSTMMNNMVNRSIPDYTYFRCACPSWDNSPRRSCNARMFVDSTPEVFGEWIKHLNNYTIKNFAPDQQYFFINAWNEWGEGCHLEPDEKHGFRYLEAVKENIDIPIPIAY
ncbi:glycoside hydrolase family 99-like domain-containing protein [Litoribacter ruber]|uniref:glycosyltransferase WbsX family protein n=1 Tax=Litoribacter ruber TaxID=702568 RepID=UPI001BDA182E|nr:glycoside hydrolase family 99-like domain-containing protein [Litoribacter ruber]MBT0810564.1 glycoside hydrolase family 99-like domain-containing protein [Litoribacter ruber]